MGSITFGRQLVDGAPVGPGITLDQDGPTAAILDELTAPIVSNPITQEWIGSLQTAEQTNGEYIRGIIMFSPGNGGPPEHYHLGYEERFEVLEGEFVFVVDGERTTLTEGETIAVPPETPHTFLNESAEAASAIGETHPPARIEEVLLTLFGLAHDGKLRNNGQPRFLQAMAMSPLLLRDTIFTQPSPLLQKAFSKVFAPIARLAGYRSTYPKYLEESFWLEHVEQPE